MAGPFGPLESTFDRLGDTLINKVADEIFGDSGAARQTVVVVYNHRNQDLFYLSSSFSNQVVLRQVHSWARSGPAHRRL